MRHRLGGMFERDLKGGGRRLYVFITMNQSHQSGHWSSGRVLGRFAGRHSQQHFRRTFSMAPQPGYGCREFELQLLSPLRQHVDMACVIFSIAIS